MKMKKNYYSILKVSIVLLVLMSTQISLAQKSWYDRGKWEWKNPSTSALWWYTIEYLDSNNVYLGGSGGNIGKSTDGANTFVTYNTGYDFHIDAVEFIDANNAWAGGSNATLLKTTNGGATWQKVTSTLIAKIDYLRDIHFLSLNKGFIIGKLIDGDAFVYRTIDGGTTWQDVGLSKKTIASFYTQMSWIDNNIGWLAAGDDLFKTVDGGTTWIKKADITTGGITGFNFYGNTGFVVSFNGFVQKTTDGGNTWNATKDTIDVDYNFNGGAPWVVQGAWFKDATNGYAVDDKDGLWVTNNGGDTWAAPIPVGEGSYFFDVAFITKYRGIATGEQGSIVVTSDGGVTWKNLRGNKNTMYGISSLSSGIMYAVSKMGSILKSTDGNTWAAQSSGITSDLLDVKFVSNDTGWVVGSSGKILKTANGGVSWMPQLSNTKSKLKQVSFSSSQVGLAVGDIGDSVLITYNGGQLWNKVSTATGKNSNAVTFITPTKWITVGSQGSILLSSDAGATWVIKNSNTNKALRHVYFINNKKGWAVGDSGTIVNTVDGGQNWMSQESPIKSYIGTTYPPPDYLPIPTIIPVGLNAVHFVNEKIGYIVGEASEKLTLLFTIDGGMKWETLKDEYNLGFTKLYDLTFSKPGNGYVVGDNGLIMKYTNNYPYIHQVVLDSGLVDNSVAVKGFNLTGATSLLFNAATATYTVVNDTLITTTVPTGATTGLITVGNTFGETKSPKDFKILLLPISIVNISTENYISISPNPSSDIFKIALANNTNIEDIQIRIYDVIGNLIGIKQITATNANISIEINLTEYPKGMYLLNLTGGINTTKKIILN